jgi:hypothetical protein
VLLAHLPPESATKTALRNELDDNAFRELASQATTHGAWSHTDLLLAAVVDGINVLAWQQQQIHGKKRSEPPDPIARPGVATRNTAGLTDAQVTYLSELRERRRRTHGDPGR